MTRITETKFERQAAQELELYRQVGEFHKEYLNIQLEHEQAKFDALQTRIAELRVQPAVAVTEETETFTA